MQAFFSFSISVKLTEIGCPGMEGKTENALIHNTSIQQHLCACSSSGILVVGVGRNNGITSVPVLPVQCGSKQ